MNNAGQAIPFVQELPQIAKRSTRYGTRALLFVAFGFAAVFVIGCTSETTSHRSAATNNLGRSDLQNEGMRTGIDVLDDPTFDPDQALAQAGAPLTQWLLLQPEGDWKLDPLVATLPEQYRRDVAGKPYDDLQYHTQLDGAYLQQSVWLRDISTQLLNGQPDDLELARRMFDWTVRNIQLEPIEPLTGAWQEVDPTALYLPGEALLRGRGTALHRAWIFALLARQQGLDVVLLGLPEEDGVRPWLTALLHEGQLYLFDPRLGLAIPGPDGQGVATLQQAIADEALLRQLDLEDQPYPVTAEEAAQAVALLEASPFAISRRMGLIEEHLDSRQRTVLTTDPSALAKRLEPTPVKEVRLWRLPYDALAYNVQGLAPLEQIEEPRIRDKKTDLEMHQLLTKSDLRAGRLLHFRGLLDGKEGAKRYYMEARPSESQIDALLDRTPQEAQKIQIVLAATASKLAGSFWLGILTYEEGDFETSALHLQNRVLKPSPDSPWAPGARYNLARAYEAQGQLEKALEIYRSSDTLQQHGNRLRAEWLESGKLQPEVPAGN